MMLAFATVMTLGFAFGSPQPTALLSSRQFVYK